MRKLTQQLSSSQPAASCLIFKHHAFLALLSFVFFWQYRSQTFVGDGDQLSRIIDSGYWMVQTELLSQALLQALYQLLRPWGWDALSVINLLACLSGAAALWLVLTFNRDFAGLPSCWALGLYASSGFLILSFGHTEYYTIFVATLFWYGYAGVAYLRGRVSMYVVALIYSLSLWMHLGILFALPSLLLLPALADRWKDYQGLALGVLPIALAFFLKEFSDVFNLRIHGLAPESNFVPLWFQPLGERSYYMFTWGHFIDILYAWAMRSWLFWPIILLGWRIAGIKSILRRDRLFLLSYSICFLIFTWIWHPNLGIAADWDLFAIEAVPSLFLAMTYLPALCLYPALRLSLMVCLAASTLIMFSYVRARAQFYHRDYGALEMVLSEEVITHVTINGHHKNLNEPTIREGVYAGKVIDRTNGVTHDFYFHVVPRHSTVVEVTTGGDLN